MFPLCAQYWLQQHDFQTSRQGNMKSNYQNLKLCNLDSDVTNVFGHICESSKANDIKF